MANIAIDLSSYEERQAGVGTYSRNLVRSILTQAPKSHNFFIFVNSNAVDSVVSFALGPNVTIVPHTFRSRGARLLWEYIGITKDLKRLDISLLHSVHYIAPVFMPKGCKVIVTIHDLTFFIFPQHHTFLKRILFPLQIKRTKKANGLIMVSRNTLRDYREIIGQPSSARIIYEAAAPEFVPVAPEEVARVKNVYSLEQPFILTVGEIEPRKNTINLIKAYAKLNKTIREQTPLVIVGKYGWGSKDVFSLPAQLGVQENVKFLGFVPLADIPGLYQASLVFVYVSLYEGFGLPVLEAMSCGAPVITSKTSSLGEIAGDAARLIDPGDVEDLKRALFELVTNADNRARYRTQGQARAKTFSWTKAALETLRYYEDILAS